MSRRRSGALSGSEAAPSHSLKKNSDLSDAIEEIEEDSSIGGESLEENDEEEVRVALKNAFEESGQTLNKQLVLDIQTAFDLLELEEISEKQFLSTLAETFAVKFKKRSEKEATLKYFRTEKNVIKVADFVDFIKKKFSDEDKESGQDSEREKIKVNRPGSAVRRKVEDAAGRKPVRPRSGRSSSSGGDAPAERKDPEESADDTEGSIDGEEKVEDVTDEEEPSPEFHAGERVKARFRGKENKKFYMGKIAKVHKVVDSVSGAGYKFDIEYDDGDKDVRISPEHIVSLEKKAEAGSVSSKSSTRDGSPIPKDKKGSETKQNNMNSAESTSAREEDDDPDSDARAISTPHFSVGDIVEARFRGNPKKPYYKGKIVGVKKESDPSASGSHFVYDIDYDDGDKDRGIAARMIRKTSAVEGTKKPRFSRDDRVKAHFRGKTSKKCYYGRISQVHTEEDTNGTRYTYDIDYDDGDNDKRLSDDVIFVVKDENTPASDESNVDIARFSVGDRVKSHFRGKKTKKCYYGKIANVTKAKGIDGVRYKYDVDYDDGDKDKGLTDDVIYAVEDKAKKSEEPSPPDEVEEDTSVSNVAPFAEGDKVEAQFRGRPKMKFYSGKIEKVNEVKDPISKATTYTYDVLYDDGDKDRGLSEKFIRLKERTTGNAVSEKPKSARYEVGQRVKARFRGRPRSILKRGKITEVHVDAATSSVRYDLEYDDGTKDTSLGESAIQEEDATEEEAPSSDAESAGGTEGAKFSIGDAVKARYKGRRTNPLLRGKITSLRRKKDPITKRFTIAYDIKYEDGRIDKDLTEQHLEADIKELDEEEGKTEQTEDAAKFSEGDRVLSHFRGKKEKKMYPGKIARVHRVRDALTEEWMYKYDIDYDDGDKDRRVDEAMIKRKDSEEESEREKSGPKTGPQKSSVEWKFDLGDKIRARPGGDLLKRHANGEILRRNERYDPLSKKHNCVYDIKYDDGKIDRGVQEKDIEKRDETPIKSDDGETSAPFRVGQRIEAHFRGDKRKKRYAGKIAKVNTRKDILSDKVNYTFDIDYDDGDKDKNIPATVIYSLEPEETEDEDQKEEESVDKRSKMTQGTGSSPAFGEGDRVKARFRGDPRKKFYYGKISVVHKSGSGYLYDIAYDDGDKDSRLKPSVIEKVDETDKKERPKSTEEETAAGAKFDEGDRVEAHFRGDPRKKLYKGTIARVHKARNKEGTQEFVYDIDYDDGDKDRRIQEDMIKKVSTGSTAKSESSAEKGSPAYEEGDKVKVKDKERGKSVLKKAKIVRVHKRRTGMSGIEREYDIHYENGAKEQHVPSDRIDSVVDEAEEDYSSASENEDAAPRQGAVKARGRRKEDGDARRDIRRGDTESTGRWEPSASDNFVGAAPIVEPIASSEFGEGKQLISHARQAEMGMLATDLAQLRVDLLPSLIRLCAEQKARSPNAPDVEYHNEVARVPIRPDELEEWLEARFSVYDRDQEHYISRDGLMSALARLQITLTTRELRAIRSAFRQRHEEDRDTPSRISYKRVAKLFGGSFSTAIGVLESVESMSRSRRTKTRKSSPKRVAKREANGSPARGTTLDELLDNADTSEFFGQLNSAHFPEGTLAHWLQTTASPVEQTNFAEFLTLLSYFERRVGLQQRSNNSSTQTALNSAMPGSRQHSQRPQVESDILQPETVHNGVPAEREDDALIIQLGTRLRAGLRFYT
eukprot:gb/GECG01008383.1/.p1 GENE.gb/GECG01008383.1/~~gb/GECG01008383.1/.p1  ORF type:complete len:1694 (+),score=341.42 gb/GECG01008383.1/:1-5082(+)